MGKLGELSEEIVRTILEIYGVFCYLEHWTRIYFKQGAHCTSGPEIILVCGLMNFVPVYHLYLPATFSQPLTSFVAELSNLFKVQTDPLLDEDKQIQKLFPESQLQTRLSQKNTLGCVGSGWSFSRAVRPRALEWQAQSTSNV